MLFDLAKVENIPSIIDELSRKKCVICALLLFDLIEGLVIILGDYLSHYRRTLIRYVFDTHIIEY